MEVAINSYVVEREEITKDIVIVDIDDTIQNLGIVMVDMLNKQFGKNYKPSEIKEWNTGANYGMSPVEFNEWIVANVKYSELELFDGVIEYFTKLKENENIQLWLLSFRGFSPVAAKATIACGSINSFPFDRMDLICARMSKADYILQRIKMMEDSAKLEGRDIKINIHSVYDDHAPTIKEFKEKTEAYCYQPKVLDYVEEIGIIINPFTFYE